VKTGAAKQTVLVIDDEVQILRLLRITLEAAGFNVIEADTGRMGLDEAARCQPDAIILDLGLPDLGGLDVLKQLREWSKVPVLVLTVLAAERDKVAALDAGADDYLTKPLRVRRADGQAPGHPPAGARGERTVGCDLRRHRDGPGRARRAPRRG
jgi:CheY-like chemotaxis protein